MKTIKAIVALLRRIIMNNCTVMALLLSLFLITGFLASDDVLAERNNINSYKIYYLESDNFRLIKNEPDGSKDQYNFRYKNDLLPPLDADPQPRFKERPGIDLNSTDADFQILNLCIWTADTAQSLQIGRRSHPEYNEWESKSLVTQILKGDKTNPLLIRTILAVFDDLWENYPIEMTSTQVFVNSYNACILKARRIRKEVEEEEYNYM